MLFRSLPFWHFDNDLMAFNDGSLGAGFKLNGMDINCASNEAINIFCKKVENFRRTSQYSCIKVIMTAADLLILNVKVNNAEC